MSDDYSVDDPTKIQGRDEIVPGTRNLAEIRLQRALAAIRDVHGSLLLPGAGAGRYARAVARARPDLTVHAGDLSEIAVAEAVAHDDNIQYRVFDAQELPYDDGTFEAVIFFDLIEHVPSPAQLLSECRRVLKPGGVLHLFAPLEDQPRTLYRLLRHDRPIPIHRWKHSHVGHLQRFDRDRLHGEVEAAGLRTIREDYSFHLAGQVLDIADYWHRDRAAGGPGRLPLPLVNLVTKGIVMITWRLAYLEDRIYSGSVLASGIHLTAIRTD